MFIARGKEDALVTLNMVAGESVYGEKRMAVEVRIIRFLENFIGVIYQGRICCHGVVSHDKYKFSWKIKFGKLDSYA